MNRRAHLGWTFLMVVCLGSATPVTAEWPEDPTVNVAISTANGYQSYRALDAVTDGAGGAIFVWDDQRNGTHDVYAQRVDAEGNVLWPIDGVLVAATEDTWGFNFDLAAVPDGSGGVIVAWVDQTIPPPPATAEDTNIRAQRVDSAGDRRWPDGSPTTRGVSICSADGDQVEVEATSDKNGGAYIVWTDERDMPTERSVYIQRMDADGYRQWIENGKQVVLLGDPQNESEPAIAGDEYPPPGVDGAIIAWKDGRNSQTTNFDIYAQRMTSNGVRLWGDSGVPVTEANYGQRDPVIVPTGTGGAIVAWVDHRDPSGTGADVWGQRLEHEFGSILWEEDGRPICVEDLEQDDLAIAPDGNEGAVVVWEDRRNAVDTVTDIYAQRVNGVGDPLWGVGGKPVCTAEDEQYRPVVAKVGTRKWMVAWSDYRGDHTVVAQRYGAWGHKEGPLNGLPVSLAPSWQELPVIVPMELDDELDDEHDDEAIIGWTDWRNPGTACDVYAQGNFFGVFKNLFEDGAFDGWSDVVGP